MPTAKGFELTLSRPKVKSRGKTAMSQRGGTPMRGSAAPGGVHGGGGLRALIFDVDGTLADTERHGHLAACNAAFAELGLPIRWSWEEYLELLKIPGNENRMRLALGALGTLSPAEAEATAA